MKKISAKFLLALAMIALPSFAQGPGGGSGSRPAPDPAAMIQRRLDRLTAVLTLTPDQQTAIKTAWTNEATALTALRPQMQTARQSLQTAVQNGDANGIAQAANAIGGLTAQLTLTSGQANAAFLKALTADQRSKLDQLKGFGRGGAGGFGPGGFGGGPMQFGGPGPRN